MVSNGKLVILTKSAEKSIDIILHDMYVLMKKCFVPQTSFWPFSLDIPRRIGMQGKGVQFAGRHIH